MLTMGTSTMDRTIRIAPALMGDARLNGQDAAALTRPGKDFEKKENTHIWNTVPPMPTTKLVQAAALVTFLENKPHMNGPRNAPARAPQE